MNEIIQNVTTQVKYYAEAEIETYALNVYVFGILGGILATLFIMTVCYTSYLEKKIKKLEEKELLSKMDDKQKLIYLTK